MTAFVLYVYVHKASSLGLRFLVNNESCVAIYLPLLFYVFRPFLGFLSSFVVSSPPPADLSPILVGQGQSSIFGA